MNEFQQRFGQVGWFWHSVAKAYIRLFGWRVVGEVPRETKALGIIAPHTSTWDIPLMFIMANYFRIKSNWLAKDSLLKPPMGWITKPLGALPVDRSSNHNYVDQVSELIRKQDRIYLAIAPEGTRSYTDRWKSGFYFIALKAKVPIACMMIDYRKKELGFGPLIYPSGDLEKDCERIFAFYETVTPRHPERRAPMRFNESGTA